MFTETETSTNWEILVANCGKVFFLLHFVPKPTASQMYFKADFSLLLLILNHIILKSLFHKILCEIDYLVRAFTHANVHT